MPTHYFMIGDFKIEYWKDELPYAYSLTYTGTDGSQSDFYGWFDDWSEFPTLFGGWKECAN